MLVAMFGIAASIDVLSAVISPNEHVVPWWGATQSPDSGSDALADQNFKLTSCDLLLSIKNSQLTAAYTLTAAATSGLAKSLNSSHDAATQSKQVDGLIGYIVIAEFDRGFGGHDHTWKPLIFGQPQLNVTSKEDQIKVSSYPVELQLNTQLMTVFQKPADMSAATDRISIQANGLQISSSSGMTLASISTNQATMAAAASTVSFTIKEPDPKNGLLTLLRASGGVFIPIFNNLLSGLGTYLIYLVLLLGLVLAAQKSEDNRVIAASRDVLFIIVAALITSYVLELMTEIDESIHVSYIRPQVGPIGLLIAGVLVVWPTACVAARPGRDAPNRHAQKKFYLLTSLSLIAELAAYWIAVYTGWQVNPLAHPAGLAAAAVAACLTLVLAVEIRPSASMVATGLTAAAGLAILLAASVLAPVLSATAFDGDRFHGPHVNLGGKLVYLAAAIMLFGGLAVLSYRIVQSKVHNPLGRRLTWFAITLLIGICIIPNAVENSQIAAPHTPGPSVSAFFGLVFSLPQLLNWLLLALAITAVMSLKEKPYEWLVARYLAIPIALLLIYQNVTWLYIPVTLVIGTVTVATLLLPCDLTADKRRRPEPALRQALDGAINAWRRAAVAADQSQRLNALAAKAAKNPRKTDLVGYKEAFESLAERQDFLSAEQARQQATAQTLKTEAFCCHGLAPNRKTAKQAALLGALFGIVPAVISIITRQNFPSDNPYFFLQFFGGAAWGIFIWPLLGWFIGYFAPIIRGRSGTLKAVWIILTYLIGTLPMDIIWNTTEGWLNFLINLSLFGPFVMLSCVIVCEIMTLKAAGLEISDWVKVHNWRFIITWSAAVLAALGTAAVTFLSTAATDLSHQTVTVVTGSSSEYNPGSAP
ncbi:MAG: hypothetical protein ACLPKE_24385 [Streptosporangiaceae bacterium]